MRAGIPRLLVVEAGVKPPLCSDPREDWVRAPVSRSDLEARVAALLHRAYSRRTPTLDESGTLHYGHRSVTLSVRQTQVLELLIQRFEEVVSRQELEEHLMESSQRSLSRNALDLQIMRLRKRLDVVGLSIRTAWGRGYLLEATTDQADLGEVGS